MVTRTLPSLMIEIREYLDGSGNSAFAKWFRRLGSEAAAKVTTALEKMERGLMGDVRPVGEGVSERRIDFGPGYRMYFGSVKDKHTTKIVILLCGGSKKSQSEDIKVAKACWKEYKSRKRKGER